MGIDRRPILRNVILESMISLWEGCEDATTEPLITLNPIAIARRLRPAQSTQGAFQETYSPRYPDETQAMMTPRFPTPLWTPRAVSRRDPVKALDIQLVPT